MLRLFFFISLGIFHVLGSSLFAQDTIRTIAVGDSYTIGTGVSPHQAWPSLVVEHLKREGTPVELVANLARGGVTTEDVLDRQIPLCRSLRPGLVTLLIGVNDWVRGVDEESFKRNYHLILDQMQEILPNKKRLILLTIPDFSVTPVGAKFAGGRNIAEGVSSFNAIILKEAEARGLKSVDLYPVSRQMGKNPALIAPDNLHPSTQTHELWEKVIYTAMKEVLQQE